MGCSFVYIAYRLRRIYFPCRGLWFQRSKIYFRILFFFCNLLDRFRFSVAVVSVSSAHSEIVLSSLINIQTSFEIESYMLVDAFVFALNRKIVSSVLFRYLFIAIAEVLDHNSTCIILLSPLLLVIYRKSPSALVWCMFLDVTNFLIFLPKRSDFLRSEISINDIKIISDYW